MLCNKVLNLLNKTVQTASATRIIASNLKVRSYSAPAAQEYVVDDTVAEKAFSDSVVKTVNEAVKNNNRLFAVVHVCGKQFKVTDNDLILIDGYWPPNVGDRIKLQKVLLVGGRDFTLIGRPILDTDTVSVTGTVIDKDLSHTRTNFERIKRKQFMRINFIRKEITMLRINSVNITQDIDNRKDVQEMGSRVMQS